MYAKVLLPDVNPHADPGTMLPFIIATAPEGSETIDALAERGWARSTGTPPVVDGQVTIPPGTLAGSLTVISENDTILTDNANPESPPGWWSGVDARGDRAIVWVVPSDVDLRDRDRLGDQLADVIEQRSGVWAELPVAH